MDIPARFESIRKCLSVRSKRRTRHTWLEALLMTSVAAGALGAVLRLPPDQALQAEPVAAVLALLPATPLRVTSLETLSSPTRAPLEVAFADAPLVARSAPTEPPNNVPHADPLQPPSDEQPPVPSVPAKSSKAPADRQASATIYTVQVAAPDNRPEADRMADRLTSKGYEVFVQVPPGGKLVVFRVRVGIFRTRLEAEAVATRLRTEEGFDPWLVQTALDQPSPSEH